MTKFRGYTNGYSTIALRVLMPKYISEDVTSFGERLTELRKAAGYTQQELADELGITRRMVIYYERESDFPPAAFLPDLAHLLGVTADELLGIKPMKKMKKPDTRLQRRMQKIEKMSAAKRRQVLQVIDTFIEAEQVRQKAG